MIDRIESTTLRGAEAKPVAAGGGRQPGGQPQRAPKRPRAPFGECEDTPERIDELTARLAAALSDRTARAPSLSQPSVSDVAARIARDGAGALAAQAGLGAAGVRFVLDASDGESAVQG